MLWKVLNWRFKLCCTGFNGDQSQQSTRGVSNFFTGSDGAQLLLVRMEEHHNVLGMGLSPCKCSSFRIVPHFWTGCLKDPLLHFRSGLQVPFAKLEGSLRYFGAGISPWSRMRVSFLRMELDECIRRVKCLTLNPHQKLQLICRFIIPHYLYHLTVAIPSATVLRPLDTDGSSG